MITLPDYYMLVLEFLGFLMIVNFVDDQAFHIVTSVPQLIDQVYLPQGSLPAGFLHMVLNISVPRIILLVEFHIQRKILILIHTEIIHQQR